MQKNKKKPEEQAQQDVAAQVQGALTIPTETYAAASTFGGGNYMVGARRPPAPPGVINP